MINVFKESQINVGAGMGQHMSVYIVVDLQKNW